MSKPLDQMTDEEKAQQYKQYLLAMRKDLGINSLDEKVDKLLNFLKPDKESGEESKMSKEDRDKLMTADDVLEFLDRLGSIGQKYNLIEGQQDPAAKFYYLMGQQYSEMLGWRLGQDWKEFQKMKEQKHQ